MTWKDIVGPLLIAIVIAAVIIVLVAIPHVKECRMYCQYLQEIHPDYTIRWESPTCKVLVGDDWYPGRWVFPTG